MPDNGGRFDLVIFDCDGVLIDSEIISAQMLIDELARKGVAIDLEYVARHFLGRSYPTVMRVIARDFALSLPPEFEEEYRQRLLATFERDLRIMPGVQDVLSRLAIPWCVATSSSPRRVERSLQIVELADLAGRRVFTASEVAHGKPAPDLFLHAAARMGVQPGPRCLVIEDSLNGVIAGRAAGMTVWRFIGGSHLARSDLSAPPEARSDMQFASFADFYEIAPELKRKDGRSP